MKQLPVVFLRRRVRGLEESLPKASSLVVKNSDLELKGMAQSDQFTMQFLKKLVCIAKIQKVKSARLIFHLSRWGRGVVLVKR